MTAPRRPHVSARIPFLWHQLFGRKPVEIEALEMGIDSLESRLLLAGNVSVSVVAGDLVISGDAADNSISILESGGTFTVAGESGTTVDGGTNHSGISGNILIDMDKGNDRVVFNGVDFDGDVTVNGGAGGNEFRLAGSNIGGNLSVENGTGRKSGELAGSIVTHETTVETSSVGGVVTVVHGKATATNKDGEAIGSQIRIHNNSSLGGVNVTVANATSNSSLSGAVGASTSITNNTSISGDVTVQHENMKAIGYGSSLASQISLNDNTTVLGDVLLGHGKSLAQDKVGQNGEGTGSSTLVSNNGALTGSMRLAAGNAKVAGKIEDGVGNQLVVTATNLSGELVVELASSNVKSTNSTSTLLGNDVYLGSNQIGEDVRVATGNANVTGAIVVGNKVQLESNMVLGGLDVSNGNAKSVATVSARSNELSVGRFSGTEISGDVTLSNGNATTKVTFSNGSTFGNRIYVGGSNSSFGGDVSVQNGTGRASNLGYAPTTGNFVSMSSSSVTGNLSINHGTAKAASRAVPIGSSVYGIVTGSQTFFAAGITVAGTATITHGNATATTDEGTGQANVASIKGDFTGAFVLTHGKGKSSSRRGFRSFGNATSLRSDSVFHDAVTIDHGAASSSARGPSWANSVIIGSSFNDTTIAGPLTVTQSSGKALGGLGQDGFTELERTTLMSTFELIADKGNNRLTIEDSSIVGSLTAALGGGNDVLQLGSSVFEAQVSVEGGSGSDAFEDLSGNTFMGGLPVLSDFEEGI